MYQRCAYPRWSEWEKHDYKISDWLVKKQYKLMKLRLSNAYGVHIDENKSTQKQLILISTRKEALEEALKHMDQVTPQAVMWRSTP